LSALIACAASCVVSREFAMQRIIQGEHVYARGRRGLHKIVSSMPQCYHHKSPESIHTVHGVPCTLRSWRSRIDRMFQPGSSSFGPDLCVGEKC
jgi:hypothetical protein